MLLLLLLLLLFAANFEAVCNIFGLSILINANWNAHRENPPPPSPYRHNYAISTIE